MLLVSPITQMIALNGIAIRMDAGIPQDVRASLIESALAQGCTKVGEPVVAAPIDIAGLEPFPVVDAITLLVEKANPRDFNRFGTPKVRSIERILGYDITAVDRDVAWETYQEA
jgi:hypothetical protein